MTIKLQVTVKGILEKFREKNRRKGRKTVSSELAFLEQCKK